MRGVDVPVTPTETLTLRKESEPGLYEVLREAGMGPRYPQLFHLRKPRESTAEIPDRPLRHKRLKKKPTSAHRSCSQGSLGAEAIELRRAVFLRDYGTCALCGKDAREIGWEADHRVPTSLGGKNCLENLRTLCLKCHKKETDRLIYGKTCGAGER